MSTFTLYINPKCSKCNAALEIIKHYPQHTFVLRYYLETALTQQEAEQLVRFFGNNVLRTPQSSSSDELISELLADATQLQRPIIIGNTTGIIARPPEKLIDFLDHEA